MDGFFTSLQIHKTSFTELVSFRVTPYPHNVDIICEWHTGDKTKNPFPFTTKSSAAAQRALTFLPFLLMDIWKLFQRNSVELKCPPKLPR